LPRRGSQDDKAPKANSSRDLSKIALRAVDGTLRELGEKELYLEASGKRLFRFRLLEKTQFRNKDGETVRDSLLKPGDQISVQVNEDDPETALRVVFMDKGSMSQRTDAAKPIDHAAAKVAAVSDTHSAGSMEVTPPATSASSNNPSLNNPAGEPSLEAKRDAAPAPAAEPPARAGSSEPPVPDRRAAPPLPRNGPPVDDIIENTRDAADRLTEALPNFIVQQITTRNFSTTFPARWKVQDVVSADVVSENGQEQYRNITINGKPSNRPVEKTGSWSTGEFVTMLEDILSPYTQAAFRRGGDDTIAGRKAYVYDFTVLEENSHWTIIAPSGASVSPAYSGSIWIDKENSNVLRIEERTGPMPSTFPFDKAESSIDYDVVRIDGKPYLLPTDSASLTCQRGTPNCTRNDIRFQNYHKFSAESSITFDK
jgi:hypothetical protein